MDSWYNYNQMVVEERVRDALADSPSAGRYGARLSDADIDRMFHALADATRRDIVRTVLIDGASVSALARRYPMSVTAVQKHVAVLERAGLVTKERRGREQVVSGRPEAIDRARRALAEFERCWRDRVARMDDLLSEGA